MSERPRTLFITNDHVGEAMGGNAIRACELARVAGRHADVTLAAPAGPGPAPAGIAHAAFDPARPDALRALIEAADVVVTQPQGAVVGAWLRRARAAVVYDLYDPGPLEALESWADAPPLRRWGWNTLALDQVTEALHTGSRFLCASERQRDLWIGAMLGLRLLSPAVHARDPSLRSLIDVVPFGVSERPPQRAGGGVRERFPTVGVDAEIVLWNGGIWNWLDPTTAVRAAGLLAARRPGARLIFMGRPPLEPTAARGAAEARELAARLGLLDRVVFFNDRWVPYEQRGDWLLDADCAVSTHADHVETRFSFRTRLLDCFWGGLPVVCTEGDELAERVVRDDLGVAVAAGDGEAVAAGLERVLERGRDAYAPALADTARSLSWSRVAAPLVRFLAAPEHPRPLGAGWPRAVSRPAPRLRSVSIRAGRAAASRLRPSRGS